MASPSARQFLPNTYREKLKQLSEWFEELQTEKLNLCKFGQMALRCGTSIRKNTEFDGNEDEEEEDDDDIPELDVLDDDIQEIKENVRQESLTPLIKELGNSSLSSPNNSRSSKSQSAANGSYYLDYTDSSEELGFRESSTTLHGTTNCSIRRETIDKLKRKPLVSSPPTELEMILGTGPEVLATESDGIEILSESASSNRNSSSQKPFRGLGKSSKSSASVPKNSPYKRSTAARRVYTPNEVVRMPIKEQYRLLLQKYIEEPLYHRACDVKSQFDEDDKSKVFSADPFKKILQQPIKSYLEKYYTPCRLTPKSETIEIKEPVEIKKDDEDDNDLRIVRVLPKFKPKYKSKLFTKAWLNELRQNVQTIVKERNQIVENHERQLEKLRKERLLRGIKDEIAAAKKAEKPDLPAF